MAEPEEKKETETPVLFPVARDKCPVCGSTRRLGQIVVDKLKQDGQLGLDFPYEGVTIQVPLVDQRHPPKIVGVPIPISVIMLAMDVCAEPECGAMYCTRFVIVQGQAQAKMQQPAPPFNLPRPGRHN